MPRAFLTANWSDLLILNYAVEPSVLSPFVPAGTELDSWQGRTFVSLVGFLFSDTRVLGLPIPWHRTFEEVNLRFYVRREVDGQVRRAVTFIRELVPRAAIALTARLAYNEPYRAVPMRHRFGAMRPDGVPGRVEFGWQDAGEWNTLTAQPTGTGFVPEIGSQEEFITEHYWGYTRQRDGSTIEYQVAHPQWFVWAVEAAELTGNLALYGPEMASILKRAPVSVFVADGSRVTVYSPTHLGATAPIR